MIRPVHTLRESTELTTEKDPWVELAIRILRSEMIARGLSYAALNEKLHGIGIVETSANTTRKITRGLFSCTYFLQCIKAMDVKKIDFDFYFNL